MDKRWGKRWWVGKARNCTSTRLFLSLPFPPSLPSLPPSFPPLFSPFFLPSFPFFLLSFYLTHCKLRLFILLIVKNLLCYPRSWGWKGQNHLLKTRWEWNGKVYIKNLAPSRNCYRTFWNRNKSKWYQTFSFFLSLWVCGTGSCVTQVIPWNLLSYWGLPLTSDLSTSDSPELKLQARTPHILPKFNF